MELGVSGHGNQIIIRILGVTRDLNLSFFLLLFRPLLPFVLAADSSPTRQRAQLQLAE